MLSAVEVPEADFYCSCTQYCFWDSTVCGQPITTRCSINNPRRCTCMQWYPLDNHRIQNNLDNNFPEPEARPVTFVSAILKNQHKASHLYLTDIESAFAAVCFLFWWGRYSLAELISRHQCNEKCCCAQHPLKDKWVKEDNKGGKVSKLQEGIGWLCIDCYIIHVLVLVSYHSIY